MEEREERGARLGLVKCTEIFYNGKRMKIERLQQEKHRSVFQDF
mgnify:CR=1 FL=1